MNNIAKNSQHNLVRILTMTGDACRKFDAAKASLSTLFGLRLYCVMLVGATALAVAMTTQAADWQSVSDIARVAEGFMQDRLGKTDQRVHSRAGYLDPRLQLPMCDTEPEAFLRRGTTISSRTVVGVRCSGGQPWKVYVPIDVMVTESVLVTARTLPRGHVLTAADVVVEQRDISRFNGGYLSNLAELAGQRLKHQIMGATVITPAMLAADVLVKRGQSVTLLIQNETLNITMSGKALMDGAIDQRIKVENSISRSVVEGVVRSSEHVEIVLH